jgi:hypothetical protein
MGTEDVDALAASRRQALCWPRWRVEGHAAREERQPSATGNGAPAVSPEITQQGRDFAAELDLIAKLPEGVAKERAYQDWRQRLSQSYGRQKAGLTPLKGEE